MARKSGNKALLIVLVIIVFLIGSAMTMLFTLKIDDVKVEGNEQYTDEEIKDYILNGAFDDNLLVIWLNNFLGRKVTIPFVQKYDVEINSANGITITVYEKSMVGYIDYMGTCMYFDKDGIVVESANEKIEGIPKITGLVYDHIILHEKIPVENEQIFDLILTVTQTLQKYQITVEKIYVSEQKEITLYIDKVKVFLGKQKDLSEKIFDLKEMYDDLTRYSGTLDMSELDVEGNGYTLKRDVID